MLTLNKIVISGIGEEYIAINENNVLIRLNEVGKEILELYMSYENIVHVSSVISEKYNVPFEDIKRDVEKFISDLTNVKFIHQ